jgi:hypothetical protein
VVKLLLPKDCKEATSQFTPETIHVVWMTANEVGDFVEMVASGGVMVYDKKEDSGKFVFQINHILISLGSVYLDK